MTNILTSVKRNRFATDSREFFYLVLIYNGREEQDLIVFQEKWKLEFLKIQTMRHILMTIIQTFVKQNSVATENHE